MVLVGCLECLIKAFYDGLKKALSIPDVSTTLVPYESGNVVEPDELWSYVYARANKCWVWIVLCKRTRQIISWVIGSRDVERCQSPWYLVPTDYKKSIIYSDFYATYGKVLSAARASHRSVGKDTGLTNHVERWNYTLRQRIGRFVRKTLSFSKSEEMHKLMLKLFIS